MQVLTLQWLEFPSRLYMYLVINKCVNSSLSLKLVTSLSPYVFTFGYTGILGYIHAKFHIEKAESLTLDWFCLLQGFLDLTAFVGQTSRHVPSCASHLVSNIRTPTYRQHFTTAYVILRDETQELPKITDNYRYCVPMRPTAKNLRS